MPDSVPAPTVAPADPAAGGVVAAVRLIPVKPSDVLIDAFARDRMTRVLHRATERPEG